MNILYLITKEADEALQAIIEETQKVHTVNIINLQNNKNYDDIWDAIEKCDKVISW